MEPLTMTIAPPDPAGRAPSVPMDKWGKDHWSTFAYIETRVVDNGGRPDPRHLRCDLDLHPQFGHLYMPSPSKKYPTRLNDGSAVQAHDDWSCIEDMEAAGLLEWNGTGVFPVFALTEEGHACAAALRKHKAAGAHFNDFRWPGPGTR